MRDGRLYAVGDAAARYRLPRASPGVTRESVEATMRTGEIAITETYVEEPTMAYRLLRWFRRSLGRQEK